jgi:superfamily II DNA or RNA helicase
VKWVPPVPVTFPITVVLTTNSLLGQWQDELAKFAPSLRVRWYYGSNKHKIYADLPKTDVILSTHGTGLFAEGFSDHIRLHRVIIDECHDGRANVGAASPRAHGYRFAWGVTGTPLSSSVSDLSSVAGLIGQWRGGLRLERFTDDALRPQLSDVLRRLSAELRIEPRTSHGHGAPLTILLRVDRSVCRPQ